MDLFLINGQDGPSLAEMVDCDIKNASDIGELGVGNYFGLGYDLDLPPLDFEEAQIWPHPYTVNSNSSFELDFFSDTSSSLMVNPNSIMPSTRLIKQEIKTELEEIDVKPSLFTSTKSPSSPSPSNKICIQSVKTTTPTVLPKTSVQTAVKVDFKTIPSKKIVPLKKFEFVSVNVDPSISKSIQQTKRQLSNKRLALQTLKKDSVKEYPKPAYSYSCLIAMALKNSRSGSLPVSEIYSFMCDHFPYFKTAPNGWKNSVRHNLSLNKCFEKIEKPQSPGTCGAQRKGCLWAMNPAKIAKMDDEVAKWSRKDPFAIKKAMVYPENLELLEKGEMKIGSSNSDEETEDDRLNIKKEVEADEEEEDEEEEEEEEEEDQEKEGEAEDDVISATEDDSEDEISRVPPSLQPFDSRLAQFNKQSTRMNSLATSADSLDESSLTDFDLDLEVDLYDQLQAADTRTLLGLSDPLALNSDSDNEAEVAIPVQKRPRIQGNYLYKPVSHLTKHSHSGFRSIAVDNP